jgi:hypothetical protein
MSNPKSLSIHFNDQVDQTGKVKVSEDNDYFDDDPSSKWET